MLTMLTDGVLIMQHTESDQGVSLINPSLKKIFGDAKNTLNKSNVSKVPMIDSMCLNKSSLDIDTGIKVNEMK